MNIKNPQVHGMASELARLRKVSLTQAVHDAVRQELVREKARHRRTGLGDQLVEIGKRCAAHMTGPLASGDHGELLYDSRGLPHQSGG